MTSEAQYRISVLETFEQLQAALGDFKATLLAQTHCPIWMQDEPDATQARQHAFHQIAQCEYMPTQHPKETLVCVGLIGGDDTFIAATVALNQAKEAFKQAMLALKAAKISLKDEQLTQGIEGMLRQQSTGTRDQLRKMGLARLHLKQCYRKVPILERYPSKVRWTWAHTRAIKRITVAEAIDKLTQRGQDYGIAQQILKCESLPRHEPLAIIQELAPHLRANIVFGDKETGFERKMIKGALPIVFPANAGILLPDYEAPGHKQEKDSNRPTRADVKIDPTPFLPAIRAHRYLKHSLPEESPETAD